MPDEANALLYQLPSQAPPSTRDPGLKARAESAEAIAVNAVAALRKQKEICLQLLTANAQCVAEAEAVKVAAAEKEVVERAAAEAAAAGAEAALEASLHEALQKTAQQEQQAATRGADEAAALEMAQAEEAAAKAVEQAGLDYLEEVTRESAPVVDIDAQLDAKLQSLGFNNTNNNDNSMMAFLFDPDWHSAEASIAAFVS